MARTKPIMVEKFAGMIPIADDRALPDDYASFCENTALYSQILKGFAIPKLLHTTTSPTARYVYRIPNDYTKVGLYEPSFWMEFQHPDTTVVRAPVTEDVYDRYYWVEPGQPPRYNTAARIRAGQPSYLLGIPGPAVAPGVTPSGGVSSIVVTRAYLYTWVSAFGEEGPVSPATVKNGKQDDSWAITMTAPTAADTASRALAKTRLYRTVTGATGVASYFLVAELDIATLAYTDVLADTVVTGQSLLQSTTWAAPPTTLQGIVAMPNGILCGWSGSDVYFSEPYRPHAWPVEYGVTTEYPIIGMAVLNQSAILCTSNFPSVVTGSHPSGMAVQKIDMNEPCLSRGSIVTGTSGVYYASQNGLMQISPSGLASVTKELIGTRGWLELVNPPGLRAVRYSGVYLAFDCSKQDDQFGGIIDPANDRVAFTRVRNLVPVDNIIDERWSGRALLIADGEVYEFDPPFETEQYPYTWKSKRFRWRKPTNFGALKVFCDDTPIPGLFSDNPFARAARAEMTSETSNVRVRIWCDNVLVYDEWLPHPAPVTKLPSGFKGIWWQFEIQARTNVMGVHIGQSVRDLAQV